MKLDTYLHLCKSLKLNNMQRILLLAALIIPCLFSCKENKHSMLKGRIEAIKELEYEADEKFGTPVKGDLCKVTIFIFDKNNNVMEQTVYDQYGDKDKSIKYDYNDKNEFISLVVTDDDNDTIYIKEIISRDGNRETFVEKNFYKYLSYKTIDTVHYELGKNGYAKTSIRIKSDGTKSKTDYNINNKGELLELIWYYGIGDSIRQRQTYEYDNNGLLIKTNTYNMYGSVRNDSTLYSYKLDDKSNWIEQTVYENGEINKIIEREIKYRD
jgi:hypothetical protein